MIFCMKQLFWIKKFGMKFEQLNSHEGKDEVRLYY